MPDIDIKRGYEVLPDNNIRFGIRITNNTKSALSDVEVILDYTESLFNLDGEKVQKLGTIPPNIPRTAKFLLIPMGCIHNENIEATIQYRDHTWKKHILTMQPKEVHCVCPFLKEKAMTPSEFFALSKSGDSVETGLNFQGVSTGQLASFMAQICSNRLYKVDEYSIENGKIMYLASESVGEKAHYLLTAYISENEDVVQIALKAVSDKTHGLNGFLNEIVENLRQVVGTVQSGREIGIIKKEQVINIIDSVVQRTNFSGGEGTASVNINDSVVQRTEIAIGEDENQPEEVHFQMGEEIQQDDGQGIIPDKESTTEEKVTEDSEISQIPVEVLEEKEDVDFLQRGYVNTLKEVITNPERFFSDMSKADKNKHAIFFASKNFAVVGLLMSFILAEDFFEFITILIFSIMFGVAGLYIGGLLFYLLFKFVGGSGNYRSTVRIFAYSSAVQVLFWVPLLGFIMGLYGIWLSVIGGKHVHGITTKKSAQAVIIPSVVVVFLILLVSA